MWKNKLVLVKEQTNREMEQNGEARNRLTHVQSTDCTKEAKIVSPTNGPGINEHQNEKKNPDTNFLPFMNVEC